MTAVLDASAVLAILNLEPGAEQARAHLPSALISTVNAAEVGTKLIDNGMPFEAARNAVKLLRIKVADFDSQLVDKTVELREYTRDSGLSLADRACLALALREGAVAVTADKAWSRVSVDCPVEVIR